MLTELHIQDFAIIDRIDIHFDRGLTTFTGETGAGKSIIIDAVESILGVRADATLVRSGADRAYVEGVFLIPSSTRTSIDEILDREQLTDNPQYLTLGREIRVAGRNVARVNGRNVNVSLLRELGEYLIDVHGQSEHLSLLRVRQHLELLDRYTLPYDEFSVKNYLADYQKTYSRLGDVQREIKLLNQAKQDAAQRADMLAYQIKEIQAADLKTGEELELREERTRLANAENLASLAQESLLALDEGTPESSAAIDLLGQVVDSLSGLARLDPSQSELIDRAQSLFDNLSDLNSSLRSYLESVEYSPKRLDQVEERLALINNLKRKYGETIPDILASAEQAKIKLTNISHSEERLESLEAEQVQLLQRLGTQGSELSECRHNAADRLTQAMESELGNLNMSGARFKVDFQQTSEPKGVPVPDGRRFAYYWHGLERIEFLIAPNPGEGFKPLTKIASGGETSRLMLAMKNVLVQADQVPTLVFDEIDQGIGGRVGTIVGEKLWTLARQHQVLCITHLPQLAAYGDHHFNVQKHIRSGRTSTEVRSLEGEERLIELAQMMGEVSEGTLHSARELSQLVGKRTQASKKK